LAVGALQAFIPCHRAWDEFDEIFSDLVLGKGCVCFAEVAGTLFIQIATTQQAGVGLSKAQLSACKNRFYDPYSFSRNLCATKPHSNGA